MSAATPPHQPSTPGPDQNAPPAGAIRLGGFWLSFLLGVPLAYGLLSLIWSGRFGPLAQRYVLHPIEHVEVILFCVAMVALVLKTVSALWQRRIGRAAILPVWDGRPVAVSDAGKLLEHLAWLPRWLRGSWFVRRAEAVLDFLRRRKSASELDDQIRSLSDTDAQTVEGSYAIIRFILWSIPILGFLGTVLGIADAVSGVKPEQLEQDISSVTAGLALAFDTTGLALMLTMVVMFTTHLVERLEQSILGAVDEFTDRHLAHRFTRDAADTAPFLTAVQENSRVVLQAVEQMTQRQADVWAKSLAETEDRRRRAEESQQKRFTTSLQDALEKSLARHDERLAEQRQQVEQQTLQVLQPLTALAESLRQQQGALQPVAEGMNAVADALARMQESEGQLMRLQQQLHDNLSALSASGSFEQAVHSLTAAVHLLTARASTIGRAA